VDAAIVREFGRVVDREFKTQTFQSGVVFGAPAGAPVRAVAAGRVRYAGWFQGYGRLVILDHGGGYYTVSGHLAELAVGVGDAVASGAPIGTVGDSGSLSGPRLYFEIRRGGEALDPREWLAELGKG
jgi:septal ring factor EnvC (AmiA/AmiB activator)